MRPVEQDDATTAEGGRRRGAGRIDCTDTGRDGRGNARRRNSGRTATPTDGPPDIDGRFPQGHRRAQRRLGGLRSMASGCRLKPIVPRSSPMNRTCPSPQAPRRHRPHRATDAAVLAPTRPPPTPIDVSLRLREPISGIQLKDVSLLNALRLVHAVEYHPDSARSGTPLDVATFALIEP